MSPCLICRRKLPCKNIHTHEENGATIKQYLLELTTNEIEADFQEDDEICNTCLTLIVAIKDFKSNIQDIITHRIEPHTTGLLWNSFCVTHEKSDVMQVKKALDYDPTHETILNKYHQTQTRSEDLNFTESSTSKRAGRKRKHRPYTPALSDYTTSGQELEKITRKKARSVSGGRSLKKDTDRIRSKSSLSVTLRSYERERLRADSFLMQIPEFRCVLGDCYFRYMEFGNLTDLTEHRVKVHKMGYYYFCDECNIKVTCEEDLELHVRTQHDAEDEFALLLCLFCGEQFSNRRTLHKHHREHLYYSVPCIYCEKDFLSKTDREHHVDLCHPPHKGRRRIRTKNEFFTKSSIKKVDFNKCIPQDEPITHKEYKCTIMRLPTFNNTVDLPKEVSFSPVRKETDC